MTDTASLSDLVDAADFRRAELRDALRCPNCHHPEPARLGRFRRVDGCSECIDFPRCFICRRWVGDGFALAESTLAMADGSIASICVLCYDKADLPEPDA